MKADAQRAALIETGLRLVHERGFTATGVREIAAAAGVPQGSFTNNFRSKEAFGTLLLDRYVERLDAVMGTTLQDLSKTPHERVNAYFDAIERHLELAAWRVGCFIPDLAGEIPVHSEALRLRVCGVIERQTATFAAALDGLLEETDGMTDDLAGFVLAAWHGTLLRMKVERDPTALRRFRRVLDHWLRE